ncbi:MAG: metalloregulator ArsR/SmtB family transcription factor [Desulfotomaculaceae bacterium]|nr:metalloregulator ArsR/SmtB family transcription factor [Desulfotomaculaceae bacterium]
MLVDQKKFREMIKIYKALGEPTRLSIIRLLAVYKELSCTEIAEQLKMGTNGSTLSHHLKKLADCGLLELRKEGTYHLYRLQLEVLQHYAPRAID